MHTCTHTHTHRWFEQDPEELISSVRTCLNRVGSALKSHDLSRVKGIGVTNQRETTILWDKTTGRSLGPAIVWCDGRTADIKDRMISKTSSKSKDDKRVSEMCLVMCMKNEVQWCIRIGHHTPHRHTVVCPSIHTLVR